MRFVLTPAVFWLLLAGMLAACGQRGPLYLPPPEPAAVQPAQDRAQPPQPPQQQ